MVFQAIDTNFLLSTVNQTATRAGLDLTYVQGHKGVTQAHFGDTVVSPDGSKVRPMLFLRNINDGGHALMLGVGLFRFVCMNGLVVGDNFFSRRIIHRKGKTLDEFLTNLEKDLTDAFHIAADYYQDVLEELYNTPVSDTQAVQIIGSLNIPDTAKQYAMYYWFNPRTEDSHRTLLSLYNVVNEMNRRKSNSSNSFDRELGLLQHIEGLHQFELQKAG